MDMVNVIVVKADLVQVDTKDVILYLKKSILIYPESNIWVSFSILESWVHSEQEKGWRIGRFSGFFWRHPETNH